MFLMKIKLKRIDFLEILGFGDYGVQHEFLEGGLFIKYGKHFIVDEEL